MKEKKKNRKEKILNKYHREYSVLGNVRYILDAIKKYDSKLLLLIPLSAIFSPVISYLWTVISKFVIDMITIQAPISRLVGFMSIVFVVQLIVTLLKSFVDSQLWWRYIAVRFSLISKKSIVCMTLPFEYLEDSDVMDCDQKASKASGSNYEGIEGMMHSIEKFLVSSTVAIVGLAIMGTMNVFIMMGMAFISFLIFLMKDKVGKYTKANVWDPLAAWWRMDYYMSNIASDFQSVKDIRMLNIRGYLLKKHKMLQEERINAQKKNEIWWWWLAQFSNFMWFISQGILYAWLIYSVICKEMTIGNFSLYLGASVTFFNYISSTLDSVNDIIANSREVDDFRSFIDIGPKSDIKKMLVPKYDTYEFTFENVSFKYPKANKYALENLNLTLKAGERLAVVGLNGAGKSTFIKLLLGLYEPTEGRILLNGVDISNYDRNSYYNTFAPVFQDVNLFAFPLEMNISMKTEDETDEAKVLRTLELAGLGDKINRLEKGIKTEVLKVIYDDGVDFSGGERQKLALARALYKDSPVVVLDEPTAALDALAEANLYEDFDKLIGKKTAVYISHRLSSTQFCDRVAMFKDGKMVEYGTHESLLACGEEYSKMFNIQAQYYIEDGGEEFA